MAGQPPAGYNPYGAPRGGAPYGGQPGYNGLPYDAPPYGSQSSASYPHPQGYDQPQYYDDHQGGYDYHDPHYHDPRWDPPGPAVDRAAAPGGVSQSLVRFGTGDYQMYSEEHTNAEAAAALATANKGQVEKDTGIHPRRLTDCASIIWLFAVMAFMLIGLMIVKNAPEDVLGRAYSDIGRLRSGMDYQARLCGSVENAAKPYLFFCRNDTSETSADPSALNLQYPVCVAACPTSAQDPPVACLQPHVTTTYILPSPQQPAGVLDSVQSVTFKVTQSLAQTTPYSTKPNGGYCFPTNYLQKEVLLGPNGPLGLERQLYMFVGSFKDVWLLAAPLALAAALLGAGYTFLVLYLEDLAEGILVLWLTLMSLLALVISIGVFITGIVGCIPITAVPPAAGATLSQLKVFNPLFKDLDVWIAAPITFVASFVFFVVGLSTFGTLTAFKTHLKETHLFIEVTKDILMKMRLIFVLPVVTTLLQILLAMGWLYNFQYLVAGGFYDDYRIVAGNSRWKGKAAAFSFDQSPLLLIFNVIYLLGTFWFIELCSSFLIFVLEFCVVSWYFSEEEHKADEQRCKMILKVAFRSTFRYHFGSVVHGAAWSVLTRPHRVLVWAVEKSKPEGGKEGARCPYTWCTRCDGIMRCIAAFDAIWRAPLSTPLLDLFTWSAKAHDEIRSPYWDRHYTAYADIVIRSVHTNFLFQNFRAFTTAQKKECTTFKDRCSLLAAFGNLGISALCALLVYIILAVDPSNTSSPNRKDPAACALITLWLCSHTAYNFILFLEVPCVTMSYCKAHNVVFKKGTANKFVPQKLSLIMNQEPAFYAYLGGADPNMYLKSWVGASPKPAPAVSPSGPASPAPTSPK